MKSYKDNVDCPYCGTRIRWENFTDRPSDQDVVFTQCDTCTADVQVKVRATYKVRVLGKDEEY